jgi:hypothetical protein
MKKIKKHILFLLLKRGKQEYFFKTAILSSADFQRWGWELRVMRVGRSSSTREY